MCCITVIRCYKYSLFGNKTNPVDLSLSVAIEVSGFGTCFLQWQRDFFQDALIMNYCKRIVVTQLVVQTVCSANSFAKGKKLQAKRLKLSSTFELIDRFRTAVPKCPIHSKICSTTDYGRPERKQPSLHGRKINPNPKYLGTAKAYFVCHIGPNFQISLIYAFTGCLYSLNLGIAVIFGFFFFSKIFKN